MRIVVEIDGEHLDAEEAARLLREVSNRLRDSEPPARASSYGRRDGGPLYDSSGEEVGRWEAREGSVPPEDVVGVPVKRASSRPPANR